MARTHAVATAGPSGGLTSLYEKREQKPGGGHGQVSKRRRAVEVARSGAVKKAGDEGAVDYPERDDDGRETGLMVHRDRKAPAIYRRADASSSFVPRNPAAKNEYSTPKEGASIYRKPARKY